MGAISTTRGLSAYTAERDSSVTTSEVYWYPVCTRSNAEKKACEALVQKGIEVYMPLTRQLKKWSDRKKWIYEPLIRSYLFVRISARQQAEVLMTRGISRFVYFSGQITTMPEEQIRQLKLLLATETELEISHHAFARGEEVVLVAGPLKGLRGELVAFHSQKRLLIRIENIGASLLVQVPLAFIAPM